MNSEQIEKLPEPERSLTRDFDKMLTGQKIVGVRYMTEEEIRPLGWTHRPLAIFLSDGTVIYASCDDEGNEAGALFTTNESLSVIPVL